ncbi:hypothetical protein ACFO4O_13205 [Glaciecola siphonariae]|uniref:Uncharacterized protein n=1 Tax=Glaciecola siphonariae TaxID=521012 RepID=A0ABV9LZP9_9ALTE
MPSFNNKTNRDTHKSVRSKRSLRILRGVYIALALIIVGTAGAVAVQISLDSPATLPSDI